MGEQSLGGREMQVKTRWCFPNISPDYIQHLPSVIRFSTFPSGGWASLLKNPRWPHSLYLLLKLATSKIKCDTSCCIVICPQLRTLWEWRRSFAQWHTSLGLDEEIPRWVSFICHLSDSATHSLDCKLLGVGVGHQLHVCSHLVLSPSTSHSYHLLILLHKHPDRSSEPRWWWLLPHCVTANIAQALIFTAPYLSVLILIPIPTWQSWTRVTTFCVVVFLLDDWATKSEAWLKQPVGLGHFPFSKCIVAPSGEANEAHFRGLPKKHLGEGAPGGHSLAHLAITTTNLFKPPIKPLYCALLPPQNKCFMWEFLQQIRESPLSKWAEKEKIYANTINVAGQTPDVNFVRNWDETRNSKWISCRFHCWYLSWPCWGFASVLLIGSIQSNITWYFKERYWLNTADLQQIQSGLRHYEDKRGRPCRVSIVG